MIKKAGFPVEEGIFSIFLLYPFTEGIHRGALISWLKSRKVVAHLTPVLIQMSGWWIIPTVCYVEPQANCKLNIPKKLLSLCPARNADVEIVPLLGSKTTAHKFVSPPAPMTKEMYSLGEAFIWHTFDGRTWRRWPCWSKQPWSRSIDES